MTTGCAGIFSLASNIYIWVYRSLALNTKWQEFINNANFNTESGINFWVCTIMVRSALHHQYYRCKSWQMPISFATLLLWITIIIIRVYQIIIIYSITKQLSTKASLYT